MKRIVIKFGGTSVADTNRIGKAAEIVLAVASSGYQVVTVVSAMGHTTDEQIDLAQDLQGSPDPRELDLLLTTGEQMSAALLTMAIQAKGGRARSFTGASAGIVTDNEHGNARIKQINLQVSANPVLRRGRASFVRLVARNRDGGASSNDRSDYAYCRNEKCYRRRSAKGYRHR